MKNLLTRTLTAAALLALTLPALAAGINAKATSTSHALEEVSAELHDYLHHAGYPSSYGSHGMEAAADDAHGTLHDWSHGNATVAEVLADVDAANSAFDSMSSQLADAGLLTGPDQDKVAKKLYHQVHKELANLNAYTASAN